MWKRKRKRQPVEAIASGNSTYLVGAEIEVEVVFRILVEAERKTNYEMEVEAVDFQLVKMEVEAVQKLDISTSLV